MGLERRIVAGWRQPPYNSGMDGKLKARLSRMGAKKGARHLKSIPEPKPASQDLDDFDRFDDSLTAPAPLSQLLPGLTTVENELGSCLILEKLFPINYVHAGLPLDGLLAWQPDEIGFDMPAFPPGTSFRDCLFLDTETTGLWGANALAFMVGVAFYDDDAFVIRQYFLDDLDQEPAMLVDLSQTLAGKAGVITFNGRLFDMPLLERRYLFNRIDSPTVELSDMPNWDLLMPARRLWRKRLGSCSLSSLESNLLGFHRSQSDVPGWLIPQIYYDYLRSGDGRQLSRVFYHNEIDLLSMAAVGHALLRQISQPGASDYALDLISLGRWRLKMGEVSAAEQSFRLALDGEPTLDEFQLLLRELGYLLKRSERGDEAALIWQQWAVTTLDDVTPHVELAKHFEWRKRAYSTAHKWSQQALPLAQNELERQALRHRLARLAAKMNKEKQS